MSSCLFTNSYALSTNFFLFLLLPLILTLYFSFFTTAKFSKKKPLTNIKFPFYNFFCHQYSFFFITNRLFIAINTLFSPSLPIFLYKQVSPLPIFNSINKFPLVLPNFSLLSNFLHYRVPFSLTYLSPFQIHFYHI